MPIQFQHENQVILFIFEGVVTEEDIRSAVKEANTNCERSSIPVNIIADTSRMTRFPANILMLLKTQVASFYHPNTGTIVVITRSLVIEKTTMFLCRLLPLANIQIAHSLEEAWKQINLITQVVM